MDEVIYAYPLTQNVSFRFIAEKHIEYMSEYLKIYKVDVETFNPSYWGEHKTIFLHPLGYPYTNNRAGFNSAINRNYNLVGFDVCDTDLLSEMACEIFSKSKIFVTPSNFSASVYAKSCEIYNIEPTNTIVLPHGIDKGWIEPSDIQTDWLNNLRELKRNKGFKFILYQLPHSGYRKGADIVAKAMRIVQAKIPSAVLLIKSTENRDPFMAEFRDIKHITIEKVLPYQEYIAMYDLSDINLLASRGGAFEHNTIEGLARGKPTVVPRGGCFLEFDGLVEYADITDNRPIVLPGNPIHIGRGWEADYIDMANKIIEIIEHYDEYLEKYKKIAHTVAKRYDWYKIIRWFIRILHKYGVINI